MIHLSQLGRSFSYQIFKKAATYIRKEDFFFKMIRIGQLDSTCSYKLIISWNRRLGVLFIPWKSCRRIPCRDAAEILRTFQLTCFFALFSSMSVKATEIRRKIFLSWSAKAEDGKQKPKSGSCCSVRWHFTVFIVLAVFTPSSFLLFYFFFREAIVGLRENDNILFIRKTYHWII